MWSVFYTRSGKKKGLKFDPLWYHSNKTKTMTIVWRLEYLTLPVVTPGIYICTIILCTHCSMYSVMYLYTYMMQWSYIFHPSGLPYSTSVIRTITIPAVLYSGPISSPLPSPSLLSQICSTTLTCWIKSHEWFITGDNHKISKFAFYYVVK